MRGNLNQLAEAQDWWQICATAIAPVIEDSALCTAAADLLPDGELDGSVWPGWTKAVAEATGKKGRALFMPLRLAITGRSSGPEVASLLSFIGRERLIARLRGQGGMTLQLHNTLTGKKEPFRPLDASHVRIYACGPTVYDRIHVGNARPLVVFDVLVRLLRHHFNQVTYVRNITDLDDKINARAAEEGTTIDQLCQSTIASFHEDAAALGVLPPDIEPRATHHIDQMIAMIGQLIARGHAYEAGGHVLFSVPSQPNYGQLSGRSRDEQIAGARVEVAPFKQDPADFVLWKPSTGKQPGWDSPWGWPTRLAY